MICTERRKSLLTLLAEVRVTVNPTTTNKHCDRRFITSQVFLVVEQRKIYSDEYVMNIFLPPQKNAKSLTTLSYFTENSTTYFKLCF